MGFEVIMQIVTKYGHEIFTWNMAIIYTYLQKFETPWLLNLDVGLFGLGIFGYVASKEETTMGLFKIELSFYRCVAC